MEWIQTYFAKPVINTTGVGTASPSPAHYSGHLTCVKRRSVCAVPMDCFGPTHPRGWQNRLHDAQVRIPNGFPLLLAFRVGFSPRLWNSRRFRHDLLRPFGGFFGFAPGLLERHDAFGGFGDAAFASREDGRLAGLEAFVAREDQRFGFGVFASA